MRAAAAALAAVIMVAGCGGSEESADPPASPTPTPTPTPSAEPTAFAPSAPAPPEDAPEAQPGGAGDEEPIRYRTRLRVGPDGIRPARVAVRGFFALEFVIRNDTPRPVRVEFEGEAVSVPARATGRLLSGGVPPGRHSLSAGPAGRVEVLAAPPNEP